MYLNMFFLCSICAGLIFQLGTCPGYALSKEALDRFVTQVWLERVTTRYNNGNISVIFAIIFPYDYLWSIQKLLITSIYFIFIIVDLNLTNEGNILILAEHESHCFDIMESFFVRLYNLCKVKWNLIKWKILNHILGT